MSIIGGGLESALAQLAQAQQSVAKDKDRERAASESSRRISDSVRLRVAGVEEADAVRGSGREAVNPKVMISALVRRMNRRTRFPMMGVPRTSGSISLPEDRDIIVSSTTKLFGIGHAQ